MKRILLLMLFVLLVFLNVQAKKTEASEQLIPNNVMHYLNNYCLDCHDNDTKNADLSLEFKMVDWSSGVDRHLWEKVLKVSHEDLMPPKKEDQPTKTERNSFVKWIDNALSDNPYFGGAEIRRLGRDEYLNSLRSLFDIKDLKLPVGFPKDNQLHGFDNVAEGLVLSPALLEAYATMASKIADEFFPIPKEKEKISTRSAGPEDMVLVNSASSIKGDALRFASRAEGIMRSSSWPSRMEITTSGTYKIKIRASTFKAGRGNLFKGPMILEVRAREIHAGDRPKMGQFRLLKEIEVNTKDSKETVFEAVLYEGQTLIFRWKNALLDFESKAFKAHVTERFKRDKRFLAAWQATVLKANGEKKILTALRGRNGWNKFKAHLANKELDLSHATMDSERTKRLISLFDHIGNNYNLHDMFTHDYHNNGPSLELHHVSVTGPLKVIAGPKDLARSKLQETFFGGPKNKLSKKKLTQRALKKLLPLAFRRPVDEQTVKTYLKIAERSWLKGDSFDESMHLLIRSILVSPHFLYRSYKEGELDDHDLASRLSYFLTQAPPDTRLRALANQNKLSNPKTLRAEALRLMPSHPSDPMITSFVGQWLNIRRLHEIMPAPEFNFSTIDTATAKQESFYFFNEILTKNLPLTDFIDPDFTFSTKQFARKIYGLKNIENVKEAKLKNNDKLVMQRIPLKRGQIKGGLLSQSAVMLTTANGVDTQPVLRGVWVLENILGSPVSDPPNDVPALTPDTQGATNPRELLSKHTAVASCASCHKKIDPLGFLFENFDPVGRWRSTWPKSKKTIDSTVVLEDGTKIKGVRDFKRYMLKNIDVFSVCLSKKLMTYATGRAPNYSEVKEIKAIVKANHLKDKGFRSLLLDLILSRTFRSK